MGKKRDRANEHIGILVEELVDARREILGSGNCPHCGICPPEHIKCSDCRRKYFKQMEEDLLEKYLVK